MDAVAPSPDDVLDTRIHRKALLVLWGVGLLVVGFVVFLLVARGVFEPTQDLTLIADNSEGVTVGMDMTFSGFPIGRVRRIDLANDGKARLLLDIPRKNARWLRTSSVFTLERGMVGDTNIRAFSGILEDPILPPGSQRTLLRGDTSAEIPRLIANARALLENLESMTLPESALNETLNHLHIVTQRMAGKHGAMEAVLGSPEQARAIVAAIARANALLAQTQRRLYGKGGLADGADRALREGTQTLQAFQATLQDARSTLAKVDAVLEHAQAIGKDVRGVSTDLGTLRSDVESSVRKLGQLADDLQRVWPLAQDPALTLP
ncbi:MlaD family protein [Candidatus Symbiobacter mobilis]|uniref:ABC-type transporter component n=1 Tax=Candidatus Symbiobacter mobilis CR TaxID=946483 RepID=U5N562_9BURK|nr:MlaD family protein [Candidatus Symbiobacter mobilis]AGX86661.1 ABC-type transporter component [Candidatus Symbiobacter mobilis CR]